MSDAASTHYVSQSEDTSREADELLFRLYRAAGPLGRLRKAASLCASARQLTIQALAARFPEATEEEHRLRLAATYLPRKLVLEIWGWAPPANECALP